MLNKILGSILVVLGLGLVIYAIFFTTDATLLGGIVFGGMGILIGIVIWRKGIKAAAGAVYDGSPNMYK